MPPKQGTPLETGGEDVPQHKIFAQERDPGVSLDLNICPIRTVVSLPKATAYLCMVNKYRHDDELSLGFLSLPQLPLCVNTDG